MVIKKIKKSKIIVLEGLKSSVDIKYLSIFVPVTIFTCYIIALSKGNVKPFKKKRYYLNDSRFKQSSSLI